jgi:methylamine dehydrogenase accessory protein MauD
VVEALIISNVVLWLAVVVLALLVFALTRQVGILHERVAPAGALMPTSGPKVGELTSELELATLDEKTTTVGGKDPTGLATLVLFVSPTCPVCKTLVPTARSLASAEGSRLKLVFASDGDSVEEHRAYVQDLDLSAYPYVISQELGMAYGVSKLPFAVLIGKDGTLESKGLVNNREHLESLIEAMDTGISSLQEYMEKSRDRTEPKAMEQTS